MDLSLLNNHGKKAKKKELSEELTEVVIEIKDEEETEREVREENEEKIGPDVKIMKEVDNEEEVEIDMNDVSNKSDKVYLCL